MSSEKKSKATQSAPDDRPYDPDMLTPAEIEALREEARRDSARLKELIARRKAEEAKQAAEEKRKKK